MCKYINGDLNKDDKVKNVKTKFGQVSSVEMDLALQKCSWLYKSSATHGYTHGCS